MKRMLGKPKPSPALVISLIALFVAFGGTTYAATSLPKNSVGTAQLKNGAVTKTKINKKTISALKGARGPAGAAGPQGAQGPQGPQGVQGTAGTPGMSGYTVVTNTVTTSTGGNAGASVSCPSGTQALGGGGEVLSGTSQYGPFLTGSWPANGGWLVEYFYAAAVTTGMSIKVWAVCANTGS